MKFWFSTKAALLGVALAFSPLAGLATAETLRVVQSGAISTLDVPMNRAVVVESDVSFSELSIANPGIADISSLSDRTIYVLGKSPGLTTLTLLDATGQLITNVNVRVAADISEFKERLRQILPGERIEVRTANDGIVLSGVVSSSSRLQRALELAERYAPERVSNLMAVGGEQQVMLKVRFAEMQRTVSKSLSSSLGLNGAISVEFKPFGIELNFIPRVVDRDVINLELLAAVSAVDPTTGVEFNGFQIDAFQRREASTTVEMRDGESFAIAGLLEDNFDDNSSQLPWLGDVPILGALFRSASYQRNQTELVIIITAHLVSPVRGDILALPTDRIKPPSEKDLFLYGRTAAGTRTPKQGAAGEVAKQDFSGSYGYVLD